MTLSRDGMCLAKRRGCFCVNPNDKPHAEHKCICGHKWPVGHPSQQPVKK